MKQIRTLQTKLTLALITVVALSGCAPVEFIAPRRATDAKPNTQISPTGDAPIVTITAPTANQQVTTPTVTVSGACTETLTVSISGSGVQAQVDTTCTSGNYSTPVNLTPGDGTKQITASQTNPAGTGSASVNINRNTPEQLPVVTIASPAANSVVSATVQISGQCEDGLPVQHAGAGNASAGTVNCVNDAYTALITVTGGDGVKNITVSQTNGAGTGSDNRNFVRQGSNPGVPPVVTITSPAPLTHAVGGLMVQGTCEAGLTVVLGGAGHASPADTTCASGTFSVNVIFTAGAGIKEIKATQTNAHGKGEASRNFIADAGANGTAPIVKITSPAANSVVARTFSVGGTCETGLIVHLTGTGIASAIDTPCVSGNFVGTVMVAGVTGTKLVEASQENAYGIGKDERIFNFNGDGGSTPLPEVEILTPIANSTVGVGFELTGSCTNGLPVRIAGPGARVEGHVECINGAFNAPVVVTTGFGTKVIVASQTNETGTDTDSRPFNYVDPTGPGVPIIEITAPAANSVHHVQVVIHGVCEVGLPIQVAGQGVLNEFTASCNNGNFQITVPFSAGEGSKNVIVTQTRPGVGTGLSMRNFIRASDVLPPHVAITAPAANTEAVSNIAISGVCTTGLPVQITGAGVATNQSVACSTMGTFGATVAFSAGLGVKPVIATQTNQAGSSTDTRNFVRIDDCTTEDLLLVDDFERTNVIDTSAQGLNWSQVIHDFGGRTDNIDARIRPGGIMVQAPSGQNSLYFRGRMGSSKHEIFLVSKSIDVSKYADLEIAFQYLPIDNESTEYIRLEICNKPASQCDALLKTDWTVVWTSQGAAKSGPLTDVNQTSFRWKSAKFSDELSALPLDVRKNLRFRFNVFLDEGFEIPLNTWPSSATQTYKMIDGAGLDIVTVRARGACN